MSPEQARENPNSILDAVNAAARDVNVIRTFSQDDLKVILPSLNPGLAQQIQDLAKGYDAYDTRGENVPLSAALIQADRLLDEVEYKENLNGDNQSLRWGDGTQDKGRFDRGELKEGERVWPNGVIDRGIFEGDLLIRGERTYANNTSEKGEFRGNQLWDGERHVRTSKNSGKTVFVHEGQVFELKGGEATFGDEATPPPASSPETTEPPSQSPDSVTELRADAREHPEKYVSGNLKDGLTFTPENGTEAERKVRIEDVVKERDVVLTSTRYGDKEFVYDPARDSFYEALPDEQIGDQRLVILNGDVIKEKTPVAVAAVEPAKTEPAPAAEITQTEPAVAEAEVPAADTTPAPEGAETSSFAPREYSKMDARSQEWVNAMFRMERTVNGIGEMRDSGDRDAYALKLQKAVDAKYGFGKPVAFDLIKSPIPFAKKTGGGNFGSLAEMEFAVLDANDGHQLARVKFDSMGQGESRAQANEQALRAVFGRLYDSKDRGHETRYET